MQIVIQCDEVNILKLPLRFDHSLLVSVKYTTALLFCFYEYCFCLLCFMFRWPNTFNTFVRMTAELSTSCLNTLLFLGLQTYDWSIGILRKSTVARSSLADLRLAARLLLARCQLVNSSQLQYLTAGNAIGNTLNIREYYNTSQLKAKGRTKLVGNLIILQQIISVD